MKKYSNCIWRVIAVVLAVVLILCVLVSCDEANNSTDTPETRFYVINMYDDPETYPLRIYVDKETRVQYLYNTYEGGMCVLVDKDGKPLLYGGTFND